MNNANSRCIRKLGADLLKRVVDGEITPAQARDKWPKYQKDPDLDKGLHILYHFEDDEDVRKKDDKYEKWQIGEIEKIIHNLVCK